MFIYIYIIFFVLIDFFILSGEFWKTAVYKIFNIFVLLNNR